MVVPQQLSGRTGSYMYMAPEMYKEQPYNEKVCTRAHARGCACVVLLCACVC